MDTTVPIFADGTSGWVPFLVCYSVSLIVIFPPSRGLVFGTLWRLARLYAPAQCDRVEEVVRDLRTWPPEREYRESAYYRRDAVPGRAPTPPPPFTPGTFERTWAMWTAESSSQRQRLKHLF